MCVISRLFIKNETWFVHIFFKLAFLAHCRCVGFPFSWWDYFFHIFYYCFIYAKDLKEKFMLTYIYYICRFRVGRVCIGNYTLGHFLYCMKFNLILNYIIKCVSHDFNWDSIDFKIIYHINIFIRFINIRQFYLVWLNYRCCELS